MCILKLGQKIKLDENAQNLVKIFVENYNDGMSLIMNVFHNIKLEEKTLLDNIGKCHPELQDYEFYYDVKGEEVVITRKKG